MTDLNSLFSPANSFLSHTLSQDPGKTNSATYETSCFTAQLLAEGMLRLIPKQNKTQTAAQHQGLLLSAGIHGNETAPIELIDQLVTELLSKDISIARPTLLILGHPKAMRKASRFIEFNMNRLFMGVHNEDNFCGSIDARRAKLLERYVSEFAEDYGLSQHLDLHTAIRDSYVERFALKPKTEHANNVSDEARGILSALGCTALVYQHKPATTFSSFTARSFNTDAYTVELGKVYPFGLNKLSEYANTYQCLKSMICGELITVAQDQLNEFEVCHELIVDHTEYVLYVDEGAPNFSRYNQGTIMEKSPLKIYEVENTEELLIFPNSKVPIGQRAGLMLKRINSG
ncbi:MAG: succinylglutamate desuccinylase [Oleiphilaceae bacterium]|nr:succinylglutamate desuccinylase [Oleiphilaceae bacterium]